jgi:hypothetical protein
MDAEIQRLLGLLVQSKAVVVSGGVRKNGVVGEGIPYWRVPHFTAIVIRPTHRIWGKEHDIIVDNKSATDKIKIYFFSRIKNVASKKAFVAILAVSLM